MRRLLWLLALCACAPEEPAPAKQRHWVVPPGPAAWPLGEVTGRIGRGQAPQPVVREGIEGAFASALLSPTAWAVPGASTAVVYGSDRGKPAVELLDIDRGVIAWRDGATCAGPVVGVTDAAIVCSDVKGTHALGLDGKPRWSHEASFIAMTEDRVVEAGADEAVISDAGTGDEIARVKMPATVSATAIVASCGDAGRELFAVGPDGKLAHIVEGQGGPKVAWAAPVGTVVGIDACTGTSVLVTASTDAGTTLVAIDRAKGTITGRVDGVRGYWAARDGTDRLEVATPAGVLLRARSLDDAGVPLPLPVLGELLARRGDRRLVRATPSTAALLDRNGVRAYLPISELGAVLGDDHVLAASWLGSQGLTARRLRIPPRYRRTLRVVPKSSPVGVPAELRDLPAPGELTAGVAKPNAAMQSAPAMALGGEDVYVAALDADPDDNRPSGLARFDLHTKTWRWLRADGCGPGTPIAIAVARDVVACAARGKGGTVRASSRDGTPRWEWHGDAIEDVRAAGDVIAIADADRLHVLAAADGHVLAELASDDGGPARAAVLDVGGMTMVVSAERGRVVGHLAHIELTPAWSLEVAGVVAQILPSEGGALVVLEDGDAYRIDARTGVATALPGLGLVWRAPGNLVTGEAAGGPIPPSPLPTPAPPPRPKAPVGKPPPVDPNFTPPPIATPWPPPPPMPDSWQLTLYELTGGLRARNDYALPPPIALSQRSGDAPFVVVSGAAAREALVIDPRRGDPLRRVHLPDEAASAFSTIVDGAPVTGVVLAKPLRVVLF
ncbi:MAG: hypothetical protein JO257_13045 [Deltaproteobacteria bacterium]|nr:hypothetical protein [Deltaproteobacteria bacterium]